MTPTLRILLRLLRYGRPHRALLVRAFAAMAVLGVATGLYVWLTGPALKFLLTGGDAGLGIVGELVPALADVDRSTALWVLPLVLVGISAVKAVAYLSQFYWMGLYGQRVSLDLRRDVFTRLLRLSPLEASGRRTGDLLSRFNADVQAVEAAATYSVAAYLRDSLLIVILVAVAFSLNWRLALLALVIVPIAVWPASRITRSFMKRTREGQAGLGDLAAQVQEGIGGLRTLQAFNAQQAERRRFAERSQRQLRSTTRAGWLRGGVPGVMEILVAAALAGLLAFTAGTAWVGPEELISILTAVILINDPVKTLGRVTQYALQASVAGERLFEVLDPVGPTPDRPGARTLPPVRERIEVEGLHFSWGERNALRGLSLELPVGKTVALVGPSGSGKSTLVSMLLRFESPSSGAIRVDGVDVAEATAASVRAQFALVTQEPLLFSASLRENIRFARPDATDEEIAAAARVAHADEFIRALPRGYDTEVGERGVRLSGGQKQRVCLARAVLANAPVLVLDEATSNLDPQSEREVQVALAEVLKGRTALVIAHRLSTIAGADRIDVLEGGRVVERGTHADLLAANGLYARLWALQEQPRIAEAGVA
ncbi:MAG: ABC transporter ATP-binding protein [Myxococcaceae bacterium]